MASGRTAHAPPAFVGNAQQEIGGILANDNEFLHSTFGTQPATLWPYSENQFWVADWFGTGAWKTEAKFLQVVMFNHSESHHSSPATGLNKYNEWLVNVTVREKAIIASRRSNYVSVIG